MARKNLTLPCMGNSRLFATTGEHESVARFKERETPIVQDVRTFEVEDESNTREFDRMMRGNQGVL